MIQYKKNVYLNQIIKKPKIKLIINHHAGGNATFYFKFLEYFPKDWEVYLIDLPFRAYQTNGIPLEKREDLFQFFTEIFSEFEADKIALFGHSLGAHISIELIHFLKNHLNTEPKWLGVSSKNPPNPHKTNTAILNYNDEELLLWLKKMNGTPKELLDNKDILNLFLPCIKSDMKLYIKLNTTFNDKEKFDIPISVFYGNKDPSINPDDINNWDNFTHHKCDYNIYDGDHFYFNNKESKFAHDMIEAIQKYL